MNDTQRLDSLATHGLCVAQIAERISGQWIYRWVCHFNIDQSLEAPTIREAIDAAVAAIEGGDNAAQERHEQENNQFQHPQGNCSWQTTEAGYCDSAEHGRQIQIKEEG